MEYYVKSVLPIIESNYKNFTPLEKTIADFFINNKEQTDFSAKAVAKRLFVSEASLSRFAKNADTEATGNLFINMKKLLWGKIRQLPVIQGWCSMRIRNF